MNYDLSPEQLSSFITDGYLCLENAFSGETAQQALDILWKDLPLDRHDRSTWTQPVIRLGMYTQAPFIAAANTPVLHAAFDQLAGKGNWTPCRSMGTFPVRFPSGQEPGDTGWHTDAGFPGDDPADYFEWRVNVHSKGRALLMLFLFSDVSALDAPTRIIKGSHIDVAQMLEPYGEQGLSFMEIAQRLPEVPEREEVLATGKAGTVYLCHPFLVHGAQAHRGVEPKFMAQPPLFAQGDCHPGDAHEGAVGAAIRLALENRL